MPTIKQLPAATSVSATDVIPVSQGGLTRSLTIGGLLSSTQSAISLASGKLLGRVSATAGGPEPVNVGVGLTISVGALSATGDDHRHFPLAASLGPGDEVVVNSDNAAKRMPASMLRGLFSGGNGVSIDQNGVISVYGASSGGGSGPSPIATATSVGTVRPGAGLSVSSNGTLSTDGAFIASQLQLGNAARLDVGRGPGTVAAGDDPRLSGAQSAADVGQALRDALPGISSNSLVGGSGMAGRLRAVSLGAGLRLSSGTLSVGDGSAIPVTSDGGTTARSLAARAGDRLNVRDYGVVGDGAANDGDALSACALAAFYAGKDIYVPAGTYRVTGFKPFILRPGVAVHMDRRAVVLADSSDSGPADVITNVGVPGDYAVFGGTIQGMADSTPTEAAHNISIYNADNVVLEGVTSRYSRKFGFAIINCKRAAVRGCTMYRSVADGIAVWDTSEFQITGCDIQGANDDAISAHSSERYPLPRSGGLIANNTLADTQGISVLGPKALTITGNVLRRIMGHGIVVGAYPPAEQGNTPGFAVRITNNVICDVFKRAEATPRNADQAYIILLLNSRQAGGGGSAPGDPAPGSGAATSLLGSGLGTLYTQTISGPSPGNLWFDVSGNTLVRTLPASASWGQWGYGDDLWIGDNGKTGTFSGGIPEANLSTNGIAVTGTLRDSRIADNTISTTGPFGIWFTHHATVAHGDYDGLEISGNKISTFGNAGVFWGASVATSQQLRLRANTFNADPLFASGNRRTGGRWGTGAYPVGVWAPLLDGAVYEGNHFRNLVEPVRQGEAKGCFVGNVFFGDCSSFGASDLENAGVQAAPTPSLGWQYCHEDSDPRSASLGQALSQPVTTVPVHNGGTGATTAAAARANLGLGGSAALDVGTGAGTVAGGDDGRIVGAVQTAANLADLQDAGAARSNLGLALVATTGSYLDLSGAPLVPSAGDGLPGMSGLASAGSSQAYARQDHVHPADMSRLAKAANLSDLANAGEARASLGLGTAAVLNVGVSAGTVAAGNDARISGAAQRLMNLADLLDPGLARANINRGVLNLVSSATIATDCSLGCVFAVVLDRNATLATPANLAAGGSYIWRIAQDAAGGRTLAFASAFKWQGGTAPSVSTGAGAVDLLSAISDGANLYAVLTKGFG